MGVNMQIRTRTVLGVGLVLAVLVLPRMAAASVWTNAASDGQWLTTANWSGGVPNATNAVADFSQCNISSNMTINTGNSAPGVMVQSLLLGDTDGSASYNISNPNYVLNLSTNQAATISQTSVSAGDTISGLGIALGSSLTINNSSLTHPLTLALPLNGSYPVTFPGPGTVQLAGPLTSTSTASITGSGTVQVTATNSIPLASGNLTLAAGTLQLAPAGSGNAIALAGATNAGATFTYSGSGTLRLNKGSQNSLSYSAGSGSGSVLTRTSPGTLVIMPTAIANLNSTESFLINGTAPAISNGMVSASIIGRDGATDGGDFLTYNSGFAVAAYDLTNTFTGSGNTKKVLINSAQTISANTTAYALHNDSTINLNPNVTLTIGNGATQAGLILDNAVIQPASGTATQAFGAAEGMIYVSGTSTNRTILSGSGGIRTFGPGKLVQGAPLNHTGGTVVESGALQLDGLAVSGNGNLTLGVNGKLVVGGSTGVSTLDLQTGTPSYSDQATSYLVGGCPTGVSTVSFGQSCSTVNGILGGPGANENNLAIVKTASAGSTLTLNNYSSTFTGGITIAQGTLAFQSDVGDAVPGALGPFNNSISIAAGATLSFVSVQANSYLSTGRTITVNGIQASPSSITTPNAFNNLYTIDSRITGPGWAQFKVPQTWGGGFFITNPSNDYAGGTYLFAAYPQVVLTVGANAHLGQGPVWLNGGYIGNGASGINLLGNSNLVYGASAPYTYQSLNMANGNTPVLLRGTAPVMGSLSGVECIGLGGFWGGNSGGGGAQAQPSAVQLTVGMDGSNATFSGGISESSGTLGSVIKGGSGNWYLTGVSTYRGGLVITNGCLFANQAAINSVTYTGVLGNGNCIVSGLTSTNGLVTGQTLSGTGVPNTAGLSPSMIASIDSSTQISTIWSFPGTANNTQAVTFAKCGPTGLGQVTVATNATLGGSGGIWGAVTVNAGGTVAPGADVNVAGTLTVNNNVNFNPGSILQVNISSASSYSKLIVHGALALNQVTLNLNFIGGYTLPPGTTLTVLQPDSLGTCDVIAPPGYSAIRLGGSVIISQSPAVINSGYSLPGPHSAYLSGTLLSTGVAQTTWGVIYGTNDPGPTLSGWLAGGRHTIGGAYTTPQTVTNLFEQLQTGQTYYFRYWAQNANGLTVADPATAFTPVAGGIVNLPITFPWYNNRAETLTNFPALVVLSNNMASGFTFSSFLSTNGWDLRFVASLLSTNNLNYEIVSWNTNAGHACYVWVQVPTIPGDGSGVIYAKWGDPNNSNQLACTTNGATWTNGYVGVWHHNGATGSNDRDSTTNGLTFVPSSNPTQVVGLAGGALAFDGTSNQHLTLGAAAALNFGTSDFSIECWAYPFATVNTYPALFVGGSAWHAGSGGLFFYEPASTFGCAWNQLTPNPYLTFVISTNQWHYASLVRSGTTLSLYVDGAFKSSGNVGAASVGFNQDSTTSIGSDPWDGVSGYFKGWLEEHRASSTGRSANWVWACYQNMASNTAFNAYGIVGTTSFKDPPVSGTTMLFK